MPRVSLSLLLLYSFFVLSLSLPSKEDLTQIISSTDDKEWVSHLSSFASPSLYHRHLDEYWTKQRMEAAKKLDMPTASKEPTPDEQVMNQMMSEPDGPLYVEYGLKPLSHRNNPSASRTVRSSTSFSDSPSSLSSPSAASLSLSMQGLTSGNGTWVLPDDLYAMQPYTHTGRIFFTIPGVGDASCSGAAWGNNVVASAGHCAYDVARHTFMTNWVFVPQYNKGSAPIGKWPSDNIKVLSAWGVYGLWAGDYSVAVVSNPSDSNTLEDVVGSSGIVANYDYRSAGTVLACGYPEYTENEVMTCTYNPLSYWKAPIASMGMRSRLNAGASGGPWFARVTPGSDDQSKNVLMSVNSHLDAAFPLTVFGPYFANGAVQLRNSVLNL